MSNIESQKFAEIYHSLLISIGQAGGAIEMFDVNKLKEMSAFDLLEVLSTNGVRFYYNRKAQKGDNIYTKVHKGERYNEYN